MFDKVINKSLVPPIQIRLLHTKANTSTVNDGKVTPHMINVVHATNIIVVYFNCSFIGLHYFTFLGADGVFDKGLKFRAMILPDQFIDQDDPKKMYEKAGLDSDAIVNTIENALNSNVVIAQNKNKSSN